MAQPADLSPIPQAEAPRDCPLCPRLVGLREECRAESPGKLGAPVPEKPEGGTVPFCLAKAQRCDQRAGLLGAELGEAVAARSSQMKLWP